MVIGQLLGSHKILSELGVGGMGTVYLAEDDAGEQVAVKLVHPHLLKTGPFRERVLREAEIGKRIRHPNVVATFGVETIEHDEKTTLSLAMEYVEGQTLRSLLDELGQVPEELCTHIAIEISKGLAAIHDGGVIHRDLKPENVLITKDHVVKVMDLGVARLADETIGLSQTGAFVGSVLYGAPEQFLAEDPDARVDLYALGLLLYELSTGKHPFAGDDVATVVRRQIHEEARPPAHVNPQLTPFFDELVTTLLAKDRRRRFASAGRLLEVLERGEHSDWWRERARAIRVETNERLRRIAIPRETAVYGREEELDRLRSRYERAQEGHGQVVLVDGEAGIGKTRVVDEFIRGLREQREEIHFLYGSYPPGGAATAACAFSTAYREHFGEDGLEGTLQGCLKVAAGLVPAFAALLNGESVPKGADPLARDSVQAMFVHTARALAADRPTVVLIDDLHFAPEEGRALFAALAMAAPGHRVLLVGTSRPGLPRDWVSQIEKLEHATRLTLARLGPKDLARLLHDAFGSERLARELAYQIGAKSDGNPFFAFEIIRGLREGQFITQKADGTWVKTQAITAIQIPSTVLDLIQARISDLDEDERNLLEVASCCGYEFDPRLVGQVLGMPRIPALQKLGRVEKTHRLIRSVGPRCLFDHHQVQEALYEGLSQPLREEYHAALAEGLEALDHEDEQEGPVAVELCRHLFLAGRGARSQPYLEAALDSLEKGYLHDAFVDLAERALTEPGMVSGQERIDLLLRMRTRLDLLGQREKEREVLDELVALSDETMDPGLRARARLALGEHLLRVSDHEAADGRITEALRLAHEVGDRQLAAQATGSLGALSFERGRYDAARRHHVRHRELAVEAGDRRGEAIANGNIGITLMNLGRMERAREHLERHLAIAKEIGDRRGEATATGNLGLVFSSLGLLDEAREQFGRCLELSREIGFRQGESGATGNLGNVFFALGRFEEAREQHESHRALCRETGDRRGEAAANGNLGIISMSLGRGAEALAQLEQFLELSRTIGDRRGEGIGLETLGRLQTVLGDRDAARANLQAALDLSRRTGARRPQSYALHALGRLAEQEGDYEEAGRHYGHALKIRRKIGYRAGEALSLAAIGRLEATCGEPKTGAAHLERAAALAREAGAPGALVLALAFRARQAGGSAREAAEALAEFEPRLGHAERMEARFLLWEATRDPGYLEEARRLLLQLREHAPERPGDSVFERVPLHRAILSAWDEQGS